MSRIIELNDSPLRAVINDQGKIAQIIDEHGNDMGIPTVAVDPLTGEIKILQGSAVSSLPDPLYQTYIGFLTRKVIPMDSTLEGFVSPAHAAYAEASCIAYDVAVVDIQPGSQFWWANSYVNGSERVPYGVFTVKAGITWGGVTYPLDFSGSAVGTCAISTAIPGTYNGPTIPAGTSIRIGQRFTSPTGSIHYQNVANCCDTAAGEAFDWSMTPGAKPDVSTGIAMADGGAGGLMIRPVAVTGPTNKRSWIIFGDSLNAGTAEGAVVTAGNTRGVFAKIIGRKCGLANMSRGGMTLGGFISSSVLMRSFLKYATDVVVPLGINDVMAATAPATIIANLSTFYGLVSGSGRRIWGATLGPCQGTAVAAGANNAARIAVNAAIRAIPYPLSGYFEFADALENRNTGIFLNTATVVADGNWVHLTSAGSNAAAKMTQLVKLPLD